jgi:hypothetical protein
MTSSDLDDPIRNQLHQAVAQAVRAPSTHNTQPWRFRIEDSTIELYADRSRKLPVSDPEERELTMSCGAALFHLRVALRGHGLDADVERLPEPVNYDLLARVTVRPGSPATEEERLMSAAISTRRTSRAPYLGITVPEDAVDRLRRDVEAEGAWFVPLVEESARVRLVALIMEADHQQWESRPFRSELARWMRTNDSTATDGIFGYTRGLDNVESHLAAVAVRLIDDGAREAVRHKDLAEASPLLAVIGTEGDWALPWIRAGEALDRALLRAESESLCVAYLNQPVEVPELRTRVGELTGRGGFPQLVLRIGYGTPGAPTPRRPLAEVLDSSPGEGPPGE